MGSPKTTKNTDIYNRIHNRKISYEVASKMILWLAVPTTGAVLKNRSTGEAESRRTGQRLRWTDAPEPWDGGA